jgi:hypothetical protein
MPTTLARRIRRIGLLPTTYRTVKEDVLGRDESGAEAPITKTKKVPVRHRDRDMTDEERGRIAGQFRAAAKAKRIAARALSSKK